MEKIYKSLEYLSRRVRDLLKMIKATCDDFAEGTGSAMVSAVVFLRFLCPALIDPKKFGLLPDEIDAGARKSLVLVLKVVQNIASGVPFDGTKESFMTCLNPLVSLHHPLLCAKMNQLLSIEQIRKRKSSKRSHLALMSEEEALITLINAYHDNQKELYEQAPNPMIKHELGMIFPSLFPSGRGPDTLHALSRTKSASSSPKTLPRNTSSVFSATTRSQPRN